MWLGALTSTPYQCEPLENKHWRAGRRGALRHWGHQHFQQAIILALAGRAVAVLGCSLDELHTHFVLLELNQEPATQDRSHEAPPREKKITCFVRSYSSEMSMLSSSLSAAVAPVRWSLVMISIRWSLLSKKSPLIAEADPWSQKKKKKVWLIKMCTASQRREMVMMLKRHLMVSL